MQRYLLSSSKSMVKTGHIGHDGSFIRLGGVDDVYGSEREEKSSKSGRKEEKKWKITLNLE